MCEYKMEKNVLLWWAQLEMDFNFQSQTGYSVKFSTEATDVF